MKKITLASLMLIAASTFAQQQTKIQEKEVLDRRDFYVGIVKKKTIPVWNNLTEKKQTATLKSGDTAFVEIIKGKYVRMKSSNHQIKGWVLRDDVPNIKSMP